MEKRNPTYDLDAIKSSFSEAKRLSATRSAISSAAALGCGRDEIVSLIQTITPRDFQKSMTSYRDHRVWQDVYYVPFDMGELYVKFTVGVVSDFLLLSFKEKSGD